MTRQEHQPASKTASYAKAFAHILAWPFLILTGPPTIIVTYLAIASGENVVQQELAENPFLNWWSIFVVAQVIGLALVVAASGVRSRLLLAAAGLTVFWVAMVAVAAWIAVSHPH